MRVVLDTNVIVSGLNFPGNEHLALDLALGGVSHSTSLNTYWMKLPEC